MNLTFRDMFGIDDGFRKVEFSGRTDLYILAEGLRQRDILGGHEAHLTQFLGRYHVHLKRALSERKGYLMPGFPALLEDLSRRDGIKIGLATGNFSQAAWMKVEHYGIREYFSGGIFGEESLDRSQMVRAGIERLARGVLPEQVLIIGDTPHDISSALDNGLTAVGVATGSYSVAQLKESGAEMVFQDFSDWRKTAAILSDEA
jgi:phosphoglycolate phosphatase-like HAD superfamily hydrolase